MGSSTWTWVVAGAVIILVAFYLFGNTSPVEADSRAISSTAISAVPPQQPRTAAVTPVVDAGENLEAGEREAIALHGVGHDPSGGPVAYRWTADGGLGFFSDAHLPNPIFTAPSACDCEEVVTLTLTVTAANGASASDSLQVHVRDPLACPAEYYSTSGMFVTLLVDPCIDVGGDPCLPPSSACASPCITEAAPPDACERVPVPCPCAGNDCGPMWDAAWPVPPDPGRPGDRPQPRIDRQFPASISEGGSMQIGAAIDNPGCTSVCFTWSVSKGWLENADTLRPIYNAPMSDRIGKKSATISLTIYDGYGGRSYDQIRLQIDNLDG